jgi:hypothetical protein
MWYIAAAAAISIASGACAKPPVEEMDAARTAVTRAENDPAVTVYTMTILSRAREALSNMQAEADAKRYDAARNYAAEAITNAEKAITDARTAASRARDDSAAAISALKNAISETGIAIEQGKKNNLGLDWNGIDGNYSSAQETAAMAENAAEDSRHREAVEQSNAARTSLSQITAQIAGASLSTTRKK